VGRFYLDSSAIVKLIVEEEESAALRRSLAGTSGAVSSELVLAEVPRAIRRLASGRTRAEQRGLQDGIERVLPGIAYVRLDRELLLTAGAFPEAFLRTLNAIHVASAIAVADQLAGFVTYDERRAEVAEHAGFAVAAPA
jgi:predicted nucleic acid-binding protein